MKPELEISQSKNDCSLSDVLFSLPTSSKVEEFDNSSIASTSRNHDLRNVPQENNLDCITPMDSNCRCPTFKETVEKLIQEFKLFRKSNEQNYQNFNLRFSKLIEILIENHSMMRKNHELMEEILTHQLKSDEKLPTNSATTGYNAISDEALSLTSNLKGIIGTRVEHSKAFYCDRNKLRVKQPTGPVTLDPTKSEQDLSFKFTKEVPAVPDISSLEHCEVCLIVDDKSKEREQYFEPVQIIEAELLENSFSIRENTDQVKGGSKSFIHSGENSVSEKLESNYKDSLNDSNCIALNGTENEDSEGTDIFELYPVIGDIDDNKIRVSNTSLNEKVLSNSSSIVTSIKVDTLPKENSFRNDPVRKDGSYKGKINLRLTPCLYCKRFNDNIIGHLKLKHKREPEVKYALSLPRKRRVLEFLKLKRRGLNELKKFRKKSNATGYQQENKTFNVKSSNFCISYNELASKRCFYSRKKKSLNNRFSNLSGIKKPFGKLFQQEILSKFRNRYDDVTKLCLENKIILQYGKINFDQDFNPEKRVSVRRKIMLEMRLLARVLLTFISVGEKMKVVLNPEDILRMKYFKCFEKSLYIISFLDKKASYSQPFLLKRVINCFLSTLSYYYLVIKKLGKYRELQKLKRLIRQSFRKFRLSKFMGKRKFKKELWHSDTQNVDDLRILRDFLLSELATIDCQEKWNKQKFVKTRTLCVCFLSVLNAHRPVEPSMLTLKDVKTAIEKEWNDTELLNVWTKPLENILLKHYKIVNLTNGNQEPRESILVPDLLVRYIVELSNPVVRKDSHVNPLNSYAFPSTGLSLDPASAWHQVNNVCERAMITLFIIEDQLRFRTALLFALLNIPENESVEFLKYLESNKDVSGLIS